MALSPPTRFESLPTRPPTPPRETDPSVDDAFTFLSDSFEVDEATARPAARAPPAAANTPPQQSPSSSADAPGGSSRRKKVGFSPWTDYHKASDFALRRSHGPSPLRPLPQARDPKTIKGILKSHAPPAAQSPNSPDLGQSAPKYNSFAEMLEAVVKQLAGGSRPHKLDSYTRLLRTLKAYENTPDTKSLVDKVSLLAQFIRRDITAVNGDTGNLDLQLASQALKLLTAIMPLHPVAERIPDDFRSFFIDRAIEVFGDGNAPKKWVNTILFAFSQQNFGPKIVTADRANRAITALQDIEDRVSGNNVAVCRIIAYHKLLDQARSVMVSRVSDWIPHLFHAMLSSFKDLRVRAVDVGALAGVAIGDIGQVSRAVMDIMAKGVDSGGTYGEYFAGRLLQMLSDPQAAPHVPSIWVVVILLLRWRKKLETWKLLKKWLEVFQKCVNSSNKDVGIQANVAWNRFVYAIRPDESTSPSIRSLLRQAIVAQFDRRATDKEAQRMKRSAFSSYCNLLYYSLPPTASTEQLELYWKEFVTYALGGMAKKDRKGASTACKILAALFRGNNAKIWNEQLAIGSVMITPDNLTGVDPKWTRQKLPVILPLVEQCLAAAPWDCTSPSEATLAEPSVKTMWTALMTAVSEAGSKEVTVSMEFKEACAHIMNLLHRIWTNHPASLGHEEGHEQAWMSKFSFLVRASVETLGPGPFSDPILARGAAGHFEVAPTPSHRPKVRGALQSPVLHLLHLFTASAPANVDSISLLELAEHILGLCCHARPSRRLKLELLRDCVRETTSTTNGQRAIRSGIWRRSAQKAETLLRKSDALSVDRASLQLGEEFRSVLNILTGGLSYDGNNVLDHASSLYEAFVTEVPQETGDDIGSGTAAVALAITEPLSELLQRLDPAWNQDTVMHFATLALTHMQHPRHRKAIEQARKTLWGVSTGPQKPADFDPYNHLYKMIVSRMQCSYETLEVLQANLVFGFFSALCELFRRWPVSFAALLLRKIQDGIVVWVEDPERKLVGESEDAKGGKEAVYSLWCIVMTMVEGLPRKDSMLLRALEALITSGFRSTRSHIVNRTIQMWNATFGTESSLQYPPNVETALRRLRPIVDLPLPTFPSTPEDEEPGPVPTFMESQQDNTVQKRPALQLRPSPLPRRFIDPTSSSPAPSAATLGGRVRSSPSVQPTSRSRLRHNDSQIDFAPIESSPVGEAYMDSQLLTDRQREVGERQRTGAAAMFPDISSSPVRHPKDKNLTLPKYSKPGSRASVSGDDEPRSTPVIPRQEYGDPGDVPSSSPTPTSRRGSQMDGHMANGYITSSAAERMFEVDIPSSPPRIDDDEFPLDSTIVLDSFDGQNLGPLFCNPRETVKTQEYLDEHLLAQLAEDASRFSDTRVEDAEQQPSPISISSREEMSSDLASSVVDEEVASQLANEVLWRKTRENNEESVAEPEGLPEDTTTDEPQDLLDMFVDAPTEPSFEGDDEISSFMESAADLPQGTAGDVPEVVENRIILAEIHHALSPTEKDGSSSDAEVYSSQTGDKDLSWQSESPMSQVDTSIVKDSFFEVDAETSKRSTAVTTQQTPKSSKKGEASTISGKKRKNSTPMDDGKASKRSKKVPPPSRRAREITTSQISTMLEDSDSGADSDDSILSNIVVDTTPLEERKDKKNDIVALSAQSKPSYQPSRSSEPKPGPASTPDRKEKKVLKAPSSTSSQRASPRLAGATPKPALSQFRKRKSRLSQSQTTDVDPDETKDEEAAVEDGPAPKRRRGRSRTQRSSQESSQASGRRSSVRQLVRVEIASSSQQPSSQTNSESGDSGATAGEARDMQAAERHESDDNEAAGGTAASETRAGRQGAGPSASQRSTASSSSSNGASVGDRPKRRPRSIMDRLKRILTDCKELVLGRDEATEFDEVIFEVRKEVQEAAMRGERGAGT